MRWLAIMCGVLALLGGCGRVPTAIAPADQQRRALDYFKAIEAARGTPEGARTFVPAGTSLRTGAFQQLAGMVPAVQPRLVGYWFVRSSVVTRSSLTYALDAGPKSGLATVILIRTPDGREDGQVAYEALGRPYAELQRFSLAAGGVGGALLLLLPLGALAVSIAGVVRVWRSGRFRRRWLWTLGCLPGLTQFNILWPTARLFWNPLYLSLLPAGFGQIGPLPDSWRITATLPILALVVLCRRGRRAAEVPAAEEPA